MPWIAPIFAAAADAVNESAASDVQTVVTGDGDGLEDEHGDGTAWDIVDKDVTLPSHWSPPADMVATFNSLVSIYADT